MSDMLNAKIASETTDPEPFIYSYKQYLPKMTKRRIPYAEHVQKTFDVNCPPGRKK